MTSSKNNKVYKNPEFTSALDWFTKNGWKPFEFQLEAWKSYLDGFHGLVNAPTGSGKTYSLIVPVLLEFIRNQSGPKPKRSVGLQVIWITPIRALSKEIEFSAKQAIDLHFQWTQ